MLRRKVFILVLGAALLGLVGCAEVDKFTPDNSQIKPTVVKRAENWRLQADKSERRGDYDGACKVIRKRYLTFYEPEVADHFSLLLSRLSDRELGVWWQRESDKRLLCRIGAEYFVRLRRRQRSDLTVDETDLLLDLARMLSSGCEVGEGIRVEAEAYLFAHQESGNIAEITIGCLLPLSGPNAAAGERFLRGMEIALEVYPLPSPAAEVAPLPKFKVFFYDTAGEGARARAGVDYLVNEKKVSLILGPYTGKAANYAAVQAQSMGVTMISLSPLLRNLERYPNVFQHSPTISNQAVSLAELARVRLGLEKFAMLVPRNRYGREFAENFSAQVKSWGGEIVRRVEYDSGSPDFGAAIRELIGENRYRNFKRERKEYEIWFKARQRRLKQEAADQQSDVDNSDNENKLADLAREIGIDDTSLNLESEIRPRPLLKYDFEAIVIPDRAQTLKLLIPQLAFYDLDECFLLGGRYWNSAEFTAAVADYAQGSFFVGTCLPVTDDAEAESAATSNSSAKIQARFQKIFATLNQGQLPGLLEIYGYDTVMLLRQLAAEIEPDSQELDAEGWRQLLLGCQKKLLASGVTTVLPDGEIAKKLYPLTFKKGKIRLVDESCF